MDIPSYRLSETLGSQAVQYLRHIGIHGLGSHTIGRLRDPDAADPADLRAERGGKVIADPPGSTG